MLQRVIYCAVLTLCSYWLTMPLAQAAVFNIEQADRSVVRIINFEQNGNTSSGSGFVVSANIVVTNEHVVSGYRRVVVMQPPSTGRLDAEVLWVSVEKDLAILKVSQLTAPSLALGTALPQKGDALYVVGFPGVADDLGGVDALVESTVSNGILGRTFKAPWHVGQGQPLQILQHNAAMNQGNSGGPLFNACGQVVGVNTMGTTGELDKTTNRVIQSAGVFGSSHISELLPALNQLGIAYENISAPCQLAQASPVMSQWVYLGASIGVLVLLAFALMLWQLKKQVKSGSHPPINSMLIRKLVGLEDEHNADKPEPDYKIDDHGRKYRYDPIKGIEYLPEQASRLSPQLQPQAQAQPASAWQLRSLSGQADIVLRLNEPVLLGRDPKRCGIIIADNRISQMHAKLTLTAQGIVLEDLNSANGSFVNQSLLTQGVCLNEGDIVQFTKLESLARYCVVRHGATGQHWQLHVNNPVPQVVTLQSGKPVTVGRSPHNDVVVNDPHISSQHCSISLVGNVITIEDNASTNGSYLGAMDQRITKAQWQLGQTLFLGSSAVALTLSKTTGAA